MQLENMVMNILFLTEAEISPIQGGTEHITHTLSQAFRAAGHRCFLGFINPIAADLQSTEFEGKMCMNLGQSLHAQLLRFLEDNAIDIVVVNLVVKKYKQAVLPVLYKATRSQGARVVACYHAMPGEDIIPSDWAHIGYQLRHHYGVAQALKDVFIHLTPLCVNRLLLRGKYRLSPKYSDAFVLLSKNFYAPYRAIAGDVRHDHFHAISNALSYADNMPETKISQKKRTVLIVSRQQERPKRISKALRVWKLIEQLPDLKDWTLQIVGGGPDAGYYKELHSRLGLQRCALLGRQPAIEPFYEDASIFMMTSAYEGFGLTLTEAQQFGCVPIVQNTYASLTDIIEDGENGVIVSSPDDEVYASRLAELMRDTTQRDAMAHAGLRMCRRFESDKIAQQWLNLFEQLIAND